MQVASICSTLRVPHNFGTKTGLKDYLNFSGYKVPLELENVTFWKDEQNGVSPVQVFLVHIYSADEEGSI